MRNLKSILMTVLITILVCGVSLDDCHNVFASETKKDDSEIVSGTVYQFGLKGNYDLADAETVSTTNSDTESEGKFRISGNINSFKEKDGFPVYTVRGGTLTFSYDNDGLVKAGNDEEHLATDNSKKINGIELNSEIKKGALIVQTSKDGKIWFNVPGEIYTNIFQDNPNGIKEFYTTTDVQMVNGCYYRVIIAYKTEYRIRKAQVFPPVTEKFEYKKYAEVYSFYAYDETAIRVSVPENNNRRNLGSKTRIQKEGYVGSVSMDNDDPHFGWDIGQFFVGGFTDYENDTKGNPIFLKNNGDKLSLWFQLRQDINKCYGNSSIKVVADKEGSDAYFEVPGGVNETLDFGRGALIVRKTNPDGTKGSPQIYTNYLEASASTDAVTKVDLLEEGDYEVALDYALKFDKTHVFGASILPEIAKYKIFFEFSVRNGNSMIFLFDKENGTELSSGSFTENGFRIDYANSQYLRVNVKREVLKDGFDGLTEDTRFNSVAADGDEFTDEGVYTITVTNRGLENVSPTVKRVYVGTDNILKAYMVNNLSISEIKEMIELGATITDEGIIIPPDPEQEPVVETEEEEKIEVQETAVVEETSEDAAVAQSTEEITIDNSDYGKTVTENVETVIDEREDKKDSFPLIPIFVVALIGIMALIVSKISRK